MSLVLAIDQSTSATKALLFTAEGRVVDTEAREHRQLYPQPGWVEHDADEIWRNLLAVVRPLLERQAARRGEITALSLTNQRETIAVFERGTGRPLRPAMVWQCRRGADLCAQHAAAGHGPLVHRKTGLPLDPYFSASKLQHLLRADPGLRAQLADGSALIGTIDAYLIHRLTGGRVFACDATNASRTLLFDITRLDWDDELCALWEVPRRALPEVRASDASFGETTLDGLLAKPLPIRGVMGDSQAALFAQRGFAPGAAKVTFGTGSSILLNIGSTPRFPGAGVATALAWQLGPQPTYAFEGIIISAASTLTWLRDQLGLVRDIAEFEELASGVPDNGGVYLVPAFSGLGLPHWAPAARAALVGLGTQSDRRHVARAALESIPLQIHDALESLRAGAGVDVAEIHADGGPTANRLLMQLTADLTGATLRVAAMPHCSPLGAAYAGLLGTGHYSSPAEITALPRDETVYRPAMSAAASTRLLSGWQDAIRSVLGWRR